jgi:hypothetical protein
MEAKLIIRVIFTVSLLTISAFSLGACNGGGGGPASQSVPAVAPTPAQTFGIPVNLQAANATVIYPIASTDSGARAARRWSCRPTGWFEQRDRAKPTFNLHPEGGMNPDPSLSLSFAGKPRVDGKTGDIVLMAYTGLRIIPCCVKFSALKRLAAGSMPTDAQLLEVFAHHDKAIERLLKDQIRDGEAAPVIIELPENG